MLTCRRNFTLIELMITVALVGILSSIAITSAAEMQYKAKRGELPLNIDGIKTAEIVYEAANDQFIDSGRWLPEKTVGRSLWNWANSLKFKALGWTPDGQVRGSYRVRLRDSDFLFGPSLISTEMDRRPSFRPQETL